MYDVTNDSYYDAPYDDGRMTCPACRSTRAEFWGDVCDYCRADGIAQCACCLDWRDDVDPAGMPWACGCPDHDPICEECKAANADEPCNTHRLPEVTP
jgi:hypothetical protein